MGWWQVSADTLAGSRFVISPLAEATASLLVLHHAAAAHPGERAWLDAHLPAYRQHLAGDPLTAALVKAALGPRWIADFFTRPPAGGGDLSFAEELERIRQTPAETALADLAVAVNGPGRGVRHGPATAALRAPAPDPAPRGPLPETPRGPLPETPRGPLPGSVLDLLPGTPRDLPGRAADLLEWVWTRTVQPTWPQRRRIIEADVVARTAQLGRGGWAAVLAGMGPGMRWLGEGRLQINAYDNPPRDISGSRLLFVPVTAAQGWAAWDLPERYAVIYPCAGTLADAGQRAVPQTLAALLGPGRARVLVLLDSPKSTTQLVTLTGLGLGSVGRHLRVLLDAGLLGRRRSGRSVLYHQTAAGETLVAAQRGE